MCPHDKNGCTLYGQEDRPNICSKFQCLWLKGHGDEEDRPDKSGIMLSINDDSGIWAFIIEVEQDALITKGKNIVLDVIGHISVPGIVVSYTSKPPNDTGDLVIVKEELFDRSTKITGDFIYSLSDSIHVFRLVS
jgi:hypothetical protein